MDQRIVERMAEQLFNRIGNLQNTTSTLLCPCVYVLLEALVKFLSVAQNEVLQPPWPQKKIFHPNTQDFSSLCMFLCKLPRSPDLRRIAPHGCKKSFFPTLRILVRCVYVPSQAPKKPRLAQNDVLRPMDAKYHSSQHIIFQTLGKETCKQGLSDHFTDTSWGYVNLPGDQSSKFTVIWKYISSDTSVMPVCHTANNRKQRI